MTTYTSELDILEFKSYKIISLRGLSTAGYLWQYSIDDPKIIDISKVNNDTYLKDKPLACGTSYNEIFKISAIGLGTAIITFRQVRPWEILSPLQTHIVTITVI